MGKNKEWAPFSLWCKFTSFLHKLQLYLPHFQDTRGVMSLQHVLVTYHSVCTGQEISCLNKWHDSCSDKLLCVIRRIFVKIFVSATEFYCNKSHKFSLIRFCETCCSDKILLRRQRFSQKFSSTNKENCLCDVLKQCVAATCLFQYKVNSLKILANPKSQSFITPSLVIRMFSGFTSLWTHWKKTQKTLSMKHA